MFEKRHAKTETRCCDTLLEIAGRKFLGVPTQRCMLHPGNEVLIVDGPIDVKDAEGVISSVTKIRHLHATGVVHEGWVRSGDLE